MTTHKTKPKRLSLKEDLSELKVGHDALFALVHFSLAVCCMAIMWWIQIQMGLRDVTSFMGVILTMVFTLMFGFAGIGLYMAFLPTLRQVEREFIRLRKIKTKGVKGK